MLANKALSSAPSAEPVFVESVFSTYLYTGTGATQTITNGIDLSGKGGLVWTKRRNGVASNRLQDTARGIGNTIYTDAAATQANEGTTGISAFLSSGYSLGSLPEYNGSGQTYTSWTFRKQAKFFDVVTYTGNGTSQNIIHNLGSVPGCIMVKRVDDVANWCVYHRGSGLASGSAPELQRMQLNETTAVATSGTAWNSTAPTSTQFSVGNFVNTNASGGTYVAYLFAHNAGGFGLTGTDNVISCGSFTTTGNEATINLGYEPQWVLIKSSSADDGFGWLLLDNMRGWYNDTNASDNRLLANLSISEQSNVDFGNPTATGFYTGTNLGTNTTYIYIAIRRGPMKVPTSGTSVFTPLSETGTGAQRTVNAGFPVDSFFIKDRTAITGPTAGGNVFYDRLRGNSNVLQTQSTSAEAVDAAYTAIFNSAQNGVVVGSSWSSYGYREYCFRRAPGFFDVVAYTGTGVAGTINHNLAVAPEMMIVKRRNNTGSWETYVSALGNTGLLRLQTTDGNLGPTTNWNNTNPTASVFSVGTGVNASGSTYIAYLFATCPGVNKVGSYTGSGTTKQIDCGFTGGARFVLIKRTDSTGDWYVWDSARGIVSGDDPYLLLNSTAAEVTNTDYIDTYSAGFEISSTAPAAINANGGTFIFLAIA